MPFPRGREQPTSGVPVLLSTYQVRQPKLFCAHPQWSMRCWDNLVLKD